jgi:hypothetical protein
MPSSNPKRTKSNHTTLRHLRVQSLAKSPLPPFVKGGKGKGHQPLPGTLSCWGADEREKGMTAMRQGGEQSPHHPPVSSVVSSCKSSLDHSMALPTSGGRIMRSLGDRIMRASVIRMGRLSVFLLLLSAHVLLWADEDFST